MIRTSPFMVVLGFALSLCTNPTLACEDPITIPEEESINDHCPGHSVPSCVIINPAVAEDNNDDDWYSFDCVSKIASLRFCLLGRFRRILEFCT